MHRHFVRGLKIPWGKAVQTHEVVDIPEIKTRNPFNRSPNVANKVFEKPKLASLDVGLSKLIVFHIEWAYLFQPKFYSAHLANSIIRLPAPGCLG